MAGAASLHAVNFAVLRAKAEPDAMLIDCTLPLSPVSAALDLKLGYTIGDALQDAERLDRTLLQSALEIGRASCRERVCQYVSISVVAVSFTKNKRRRATQHTHTARGLTHRQHRRCVI